MNHDETHASAHEKAIADLTAESYLLGDLSDAEADAFEMHYFDCRVCADTVRAGAAMFAAGREVVKSEDPKVIRFPVRWFTARAVAAALAVVVGIQGYVIRTAPSPLSIEVPVQGPDFASATRAAGDPDKIIRFQGDQPVQVYVDIPLEEHPVARYQFEVRTPSGKVLVADVSEERARSGDAVPLSIRPLPAGRYVLAIVGVRKDGNRPEEVARWSFVVQ